MKHITNTINESIVNETKSSSPLRYYEGVIENICYLIENAPYGSYTLRSSDMERAVDDILDNIRYANSTINEEAMYGNIDTKDIKKDVKLIESMNKSIIEAICESVKNDYEVNSEDYS